MFRDTLKLTKKVLNKERAGSSTFEWTMLTPFTFAVVFVALMIMLLLFSWVSYGSLANNLATDLNFRQTGLERADKWVKAHGTVIRTPNGNQLDGANVVNMTTGGSAKVTGAYKNAVIYHMNEYKGQFFFPYTKLDNINVSIIRLNNSGGFETPSMETVTSPNVNNRTSKNFSNSIVKVDINYHFAPVDIMNDNFPIKWNGLPISTSGYAVIT